MKHPPQLSVIISTYNRADYLYLSLDSLAKQNSTSKLWEIILVDNNSTDGTKELVKKYKICLPQMRYIFEEIQGISTARNRGAKEARASHIIFLDDDAEAPPHWVNGLLKALENYKNMAAFGGPVIPNWEGPQPTWVPPQFLGYFTQLDYGANPINITKAGGVLLGANIGFEKSTFIEHGGFSTQLGRIGKNLLSGEETQLLQKIKTSGRAIWYLPDCGVMHLVLPERRSPSFLLRRMYGDGLSQVILDLSNGRLDRKSIGRRLLYEYKVLVKEHYQRLNNYSLKNESEKVFDQAKIARRKGRIRQLWREWLQFISFLKTN
jgi:glycosyltransferase involved in cell wall biosynthesis